MEEHGGQLGLKPFIATDWRTARSGRDQLRKDKAHEIKDLRAAQRTSTGCLSPIAAPQAIDAAGHPALFMVDTISLASTDYRHDNGASMSPSAAPGPDAAPGMAFNAISDKAIAASKAPSTKAPVVGGHAQHEQDRLLLHAGHQYAARLGGGDRHAARGGLETCSPATTGCRGDAPRGARLGARDHVPRSKYYSPPSPP
jgi:hypothetical protein